jgi:hypothetical protein
MIRFPENGRWRCVVSFLPRPTAPNREDVKICLDEWRWWGEVGLTWLFFWDEVWSYLHSKFKSCSQISFTRFIFDPLFHGWTEHTSSVHLIRSLCFGQSQICIVYVLRHRVRFILSCLFILCLLVSDDYGFYKSNADLQLTSSESYKTKKASTDPFAP